MHRREVGSSFAHVRLLIPRSYQLPLDHPGPQSLVQCRICPLLISFTAAGLRCIDDESYQVRKRDEIMTATAAMMRLIKRG